MPEYLHNMSVPPWSRVQVTRAAVKGLRLRVRSALSLGLGTSDAAAEKELDSRFQQHGAAFGLALMDVRESPAYTYRRRIAAAVRDRLHDPEALREFAARCERALRRAGVPDAIGVFLVKDPGCQALREQSRELELALLTRRSGVLYLPDRPFDPSLIAWSDGIVLFPEGSYE